MWLPEAKCQRRFRSLLASLVILTVVVYVVYGASASWLSGGHTSLSLSLFLLSNGRTAVSMMFLLYWQYHGDLSDIYRQINGPCLEALADHHHLKRLDKVIAAYLVFFATALFTLDSTMLWSIATGSLSQQVAYEDPFNLPYGYIFWTLLLTYQTVAGNVVLGLQVYIILTLRHLLVQQNSQLQRIHAENGGFRRSVEKDFEERLNVQFTLIDLLTAINNTFTAHTAIRIAFVVPRLISARWLTSGDLMFSSRAAVNILKTATDVVALVVIPATINATVEDTHQIVCRNRQLWIPPTENLQRLSSAMLELLKQPGMGISLGGFAVITKVLLVKLVTLTITIMSVFRELHRTPFANTNTTESSR